MRQIKFRAWIGDQKRFSDSINIFDDGSWHATIGYTCGYGESDNGVLEQFTGMLDKNGVEIYEGDIVKFPIPRTIAGVGGEAIAEITFHNGVFGFMNMLCKTLKNPDNWCREHNFTDAGWFFGGFSRLDGEEYSKAPKLDLKTLNTGLEIIGNIHENPDLIN